MGGSEGEETKDAAGGWTGDELLLARERESMEEAEGEEALKGGEIGGEVASSELVMLGAPEPDRVALLCTYTFNSLPSNSARGAALETPLPKLTSFSKCPPSAP